jgi:hypothetical protein
VLLLAYNQEIGIVANKIMHFFYSLTIKNSDGDLNFCSYFVSSGLNTCISGITPSILLHQQIFSNEDCLHS